jgi:hypothetical protein
MQSKKYKAMDMTSSEVNPESLESLISGPRQCPPADQLSFDRTPLVTFQDDDASLFLMRL